MNCSMHGAESSTHLKVVAIAVCAAAGVLSIGPSSRDHGYQDARISKVGKPVLVSPAAG